MKRNVIGSLLCLWVSLWNFWSKFYQSRALSCLTTIWTVTFIKRDWKLKIPVFMWILSTRGEAEDHKHTETWLFYFVPSRASCRKCMNCEKYGFRFKYRVKQGQPLCYTKLNVCSEIFVLALCWHCNIIHWIFFLLMSIIHKIALWDERGSIDYGISSTVIWERVY